ncbi:MAG: hypothetical protein K2M23_00750, partial [Alphaproteobacteria bacterium]|nr:hypothetical protein [Alphaproteobacteria bacterium]
MKKNTTNKFHDLRKRIISILASNAFKAATLTPLALAMIACKTETEQGPVVELEDDIKLSNLKINLDKNLKVGSFVSAEDIKRKIVVDLSINGGEPKKQTIEDLFSYLTKKNITFNINITNNGETVYTVTNNGLPTKGFEFKEEINNFKVSGDIDNVKFELPECTFNVFPKEKDPNEEKEDPKPTTPVQTTKDITKNFENKLRNLFEYVGQPIPEGEQQTENITLTAQTIKKLAALPSDLNIIKMTVPADTSEAEGETKLKEAALAIYEKYKDLSTLVNAYDNGEIKVEKNGNVTLPLYRYSGVPMEDKQVPQYVISSNNTISLEGNFYYTDMALDISKLTNVNIDNATFSMGEDNSEYEVYVDMIESLYKDLNLNEALDSDEILRSNEDNNFNNYKTPKLDFNLTGIAYYSDDLKKLTSLYKIYDKKYKLNNIQVSLEQNSTMVFNGKKEGEKTILFDKDNNLNKNVPHVSVNVLSKLAELGGTDSHRRLENLVITGNYTKEEKEIDIKSSLVNIVFTGDVSGLKNSSNYQFNGVVY